jgi:hypothetical protein
MVSNERLWSQHNGTRLCMKRRDASVSDPERRLYRSSRAYPPPPEAGRQINPRRRRAKPSTMAARPALLDK